MGLGSRRGLKRHTLVVAVNCLHILAAKTVLSWYEFTG